MISLWIGFSMYSITCSSLISSCRFNLYINTPYLYHQSNTSSDFSFLVELWIRLPFPCQGICGIISQPVIKTLVSWFLHIKLNEPIVILSIESSWYKLKNCCSFYLEMWNGYFFSCSVKHLVSFLSPYLHLCFSFSLSLSLTVSLA